MLNLIILISIVGEIDIILCVNVRHALILLWRLLIQL